MNLKDADVQDLLLMAARAPDRTLPEYHLLERLTLRMLEGHEAGWVEVALQAGHCPSCLWPLERCPECDPDEDTPAKFLEPYCGTCDTHWANVLDVAAGRV
jgi:hypothetical protein